MITFLLNLILIAGFVFFVIVCVTALRIYRSFHNLKKRFTGNDGRAADFRNTYGGGRTGATEADGEVVIDRRSPDEARRKIFSKSEGEYVDFEETK